MADIKHGYIDLRKPETCLDCCFRDSRYNSDTDEDDESCVAWWFGGHGSELRDLSYEDDRYTTPDWCVLTPADNDEAKVRLTVELPGHCRECRLLTAIEEDGIDEDCHCYAINLLDSERMVAESIFNIPPEIRQLTQAEFEAKERPAWCPLKIVEEA